MEGARARVYAWINKEVPARPLPPLPVVRDLPGGGTGTLGGTWLQEHQLFTLDIDDTRTKTGDYTRRLLVGTFLPTRPFDGSAG